ncbi:MAG: LytTR family DNA-binding domain-containing protein [Hyphomonadaceae bacterium]
MSEMPLSTRLFYWVPLMVGGSGVAHLITLAMGRLRGLSQNPWLFGAVLSMALSIPITLAVWAYTTALVGTTLQWEFLPQLYGGVLVICIAMTAIMILVNWPGRVTHAPPAGAPTRRVRFMERLPSKLAGGVIYAVSSEDHYLRLHTSKGSDLLLMRLSDAITELDGLEGAQTHRSWWVARDAVESARRDGDKVVLVLKSGAEAPVSRPNVRPLREAGWF